MSHLCQSTEQLSQAVFSNRPLLVPACSKIYQMGTDPQTHCENARTPKDTQNPRSKEETKLQKSKTPERQNIKTPKTQKQTRGKTPELQNTRSPKHPRHPRHQNAKLRKQEMRTPEHQNTATPKTPPPEPRIQETAETPERRPTKKHPRRPNSIKTDRTKKQVNTASATTEHSQVQRNKGRWTQRKGYNCSGHGKKT